MKHGGVNTPEVIALNRLLALLFLLFLPIDLIANIPRTCTSTGNLRSGTLCAYTWDAWDQLTRFDCRNPSEPVERIEFEYDHLGRRIQKTVTLTNASVVATKFIRDGWKLVAELDSSFNLVRSYLWGADLSQTRNGAAGVGGLVGVNIQTNGFYFATSDGRGNVTGLVKPTVSAPSVRYDYSPFGELIRASGELADANPLRYSTKYFDDETGLIYFGHRYYHPAQGRWASPDPLEELGGVNLYGFLNNNALNFYDPQGLEIRRMESATILGWIPAPTGPLGYYDGDTITEDINSQIANVPALALNSVHAAGQGLMTLAGYLGDGLTELENNTVGPNGLNAMGPIGATASGSIKVGGKGLQWLGKLAKLVKCAPDPKRGVWLLGPGPRGLAIESQLGGNLPANFPVIDKFANGIATSIKSIDLAMASYQDAANLTRILNKYVDAVADFNGAARADQVIQASQITARQLQLAIPPGSASAAQQAVINAAAARAQGMGVNFIVTPFP